MFFCKMPCAWRKYPCLPICSQLFIAIFQVVCVTMQPHNYKLLHKQCGSKVGLLQHLRKKHQELSGDMRDLDKKTTMSQGENMIRNGPTAHVCHICGKEGNSSNIIDHIKTNHLKEISFPCNHCEKIFSARRCLMNHNNKNH